MAATRHLLRSAQVPLRPPPDVEATRRSAMPSIRSLALTAGLTMALAAPTSAAVVCKKPSGVITVREACKKKETPLDLAQFGAVGPPGAPGTPGTEGQAGLNAWERPCPPDAVRSETTCMDKFEASVWRVPNPTTTNAELVAKIEQGTATAADLEAGDATALGTGSDDYAPCADSGQNCANDIYAVSLAGVSPSGNVTWFQAQMACKNARKRLPSNAEWQAAVAGTPDPGSDDGTTDCNSAGGFLITGSRSACVSSDGAFDMVGNLYELVADWVPKSLGCDSWNAGVSPTSDQQCLTTQGEPFAVMRGGFNGNGPLAGPLAINTIPLSSSLSAVGFRCTR
jgi:hypothetical protein